MKNRKYRIVSYVILIVVSMYLAIAFFTSDEAYGLLKGFIWLALATSTGYNLRKLLRKKAPAA